MDPINLPYCPRTPAPSQRHKHIRTQAPPLPPSSIPSLRSDANTYKTKKLAKNSASKVETAGMVRASSAPPAVRYGTGGNGSGSFPSGPGSKGGPGSTMGALPTVGETVAAYSGGPSRAEEAAMLAAAAVAEAVEAAVASASAASVSTEGEAVVESALASAERERRRRSPLVCCGWC